MKDQDFDEIGKRLYDLEADPPKDGWDKIAPVLNSPTQPGKVVWLRKNWWKPLVLLIPVSFYIIYSGQGGKDLELSSSIEQSLQQKTESPSTDSETNDLISNTNTSEKRESKNEIAGIVKEETLVKRKALSSEKSNANSARVDVTSEHDSSSGAIENGVQENTDHQKEELQPGITALFTDDANTRNDLQTPDKKKDNRTVRNGELISVVTITTADKSSGQALVNMNEPGASGESKSEKKVKNQHVVVISMDSEPARNEALPIGSQYQSADLVSQPMDTANILVSTNESLVQEKNSTADITASKMVSEKEEGNKEYGQWRLTASFTPQYLSKSVKPVATDEVLVTDIDNSSSSQRMGFGFAIGAGKAITPDFYIDGQLSFSEVHQNINFSYATGKVDTLLAVQQPDQSIRVSPVYQVASREISSKYGYGGIRLGGTYYFWSTPRRRFNIAAMVGAHYLVSASVKEKIDAQWISLSNENLNKMNYTFMVGAGYNIMLNKGWELMINPALTYYLRKVKNQELPYDLDQQSFGLNIMLSKTLGRK